MTENPSAPEDLSRLPLSVSPEFLELIKAEYEDLTTSLRANEELGERRLDVFLTVIAAVIAAIGLASSRFEDDQTTLVAMALAAASVLLIFGLMTLRRVTVRNVTTTLYRNGLRRIRAFYLQLEPDAAKLLPYPPAEKPMERKRGALAQRREPTDKKRTSWWTLGTGGLLETVAAINCGLAGVVAAAAIWLLGAAVIISLLLALVLVVGVWIAQMYWADETYKKLEDKRRDDRERALSYWAKAPVRPGSDRNRQVFRAGVGLAIVDESGRVLAFERSDLQHSWQLPQGGLNPSEDAEAAAWRELKEETGLGTEHVTLEEETDVWVGYELPEEARSSKTGRGQVHRWFLFRLKPGVELPPQPPGEFRDRQWMTVDELLNQVVDFRRPAYEVVAERLLRPFA